MHALMSIFMKNVCCSYEDVLYGHRTEGAHTQKCVWVACALYVVGLQTESSSFLPPCVSVCGVVTGWEEPRFTWEQMTGSGLVSLSVKR